MSNPHFGTSWQLAFGHFHRPDFSKRELVGFVKFFADKNPWASRNLGALLMKLGEAVRHFKVVTQLVPDDQMAWLGLGDACRLSGNSADARTAYRKAIAINPHGDLAEKARAGSNAMAQAGFENTKQVVLRQDALHYSLAALQRYATMPPASVQNLALEIAMLGRDGFDVHNPNSRYRVRGLDGEFSGMAITCYLYAAMQAIAPGTDKGARVARWLATLKASVKFVPLGWGEYRALKLAR